MTAFKLQLIGLIIELFLKPISGMVQTLDFALRYFLHKDVGTIWKTLYLSNISSDFLRPFELLLVLKIVLVENSYA